MKNINIDWGSGKVTRGKWLGVKIVLNSFNIKSVLEFGSGLSTELFSLEDIEFMSFDTLKPHVQKLKKVLPSVKIHYYTQDNMPVFETKFDMVFIDGPAGSRQKELELANKVATKVIYCDDWQRGQDKVKLDKKWKPLSQIDPDIVKGEKDKHIYINEEDFY